MGAADPVPIGAVLVALAATGKLPVPNAAVEVLRGIVTLMVAG